MEEQIAFIKERIDKVCRICLQVKTLRNLFEKTIIEDEDINLTKIIFELTSVKVSKEDKLPNNICLVCLKDLYFCYKFKKKCVTSQQFLQENINNTGFTCVEENTVDFYSETSEHDDSQNEPGNVEPELAEITIEKENTEIGNENEHIKSKKEKVNTVSKTEKGYTALKQDGIDTELENEKVNTENTAIVVNDIDEDIFEFPKRPKIKNRAKRIDKILAREAIDNEIEKKVDKALAEEERNKENKENKQVVIKPSLQHCDYCDIYFATTEDLRDHLKRMQHPKVCIKKSSLVCSICKKQVPPATMRQHLHSHKNLQDKLTHVCEVCGKVISHYNLRRHMLVHTGERPHKCSHCNKAFTQKATLKNHINIHTGQKQNKNQHVCYYCGKMYTNVTLFNNHLQSHDSQQKYQTVSEGYQCGLCKKVLTTKHTLKIHMLNHGDLCFDCPYCSKAFATLDRLKSHIARHSESRRLACVVCNKLYKDNYGLKQHMLIHQGIKAYKCKVCDKAFTQSSHLYYHKRVHTGEKPHKCNECGKSYRLNSSLKVHKRIHTGETPYHCTVCNLSFYDPSAMKKHKNKHRQSVAD